jgi:G3E family GTPase
VLVDPIRALRILGLEPGKVFSPKVLYVYRKQLEEADIIVINKSDLVEPERLSRLTTALRNAYPAAEVYPVSCRTGAGLGDWFARICGIESGVRTAPDIDYDLYADGEALLGWFNATFQISASSPFDGNRFLIDLARELNSGLAAESPEIAHFKMVFTPDDEAGDIAVLNQVGSDREPEMSHALQADLSSGELILNLRAEGDPDFLRNTVIATMTRVTSRTGANASTIHMEHFRPARPVPTYRMATGAN